ncbi:MAG: HAMP domain-containing histidine kinase [Flavobacteriaceae bacterium]|nr:HAMP domain-containing histidine kinase [Flavobacteriaceae bacterium]
MKIKHQLAVFNLITRLLIILVLWFSLPILIKKIVYKHIDKSLIEKKEKFIQHLDKQEINDFISRNDSTETYASFSSLHNEFLQLYRSKDGFINQKSTFVDEARSIEDEVNDYRVLYYNFTYENARYILEVGNNIGEIKDLTFTIRFFTSILLLIVVTLTFIADTFLIEFLLKPFYKIINTKIKFVNEPESFNYDKVHSYSSDFDELDSGLNQMMYRIQELFKKEKQFIANVSHELLTPIALLKNRFENLIQNESLDDEAVDKIASSLRTLDLLKKIINNLLLISRIENNQFTNHEEVSIKESVVKTLEELEDRIQQKNITVLNEIGVDFYFSGNKILIHILIYNLMLNAIKYNFENGKITIKDSFSNGKYIVSISDSGQGMTEEQLKTIFNRFNRFDSNQDGHGLGLAIVDSIAKFHHCTILVTSQNTIGSTFSIEFPSNL